MIRFIRLAHRWVAPLFIIAMVAVALTGFPKPANIAQVAQQALMMLLALSGLVLFLYPLFAKRKRSNNSE